MKLAIRADASSAMGHGHVMRSVSLADAVRANGGNVGFICRAHEGHLGDVLLSRGYTVQLLPVPSGPFAAAGTYDGWVGAPWNADAAETREAIIGIFGHADMLMVDHYGLDARWERAVRPVTGRLMVIDDLANRPHDCDLLLDQNLGSRVADYTHLVPDQCEILTGAEFALLRPDFAEYRAASLARRPGTTVDRLLVAMGGTDHADATGHVLQSLRFTRLPHECSISVVLGSTAPWLDEVRRTAAALPWRTEVLVDVADMARLMADSDVAIGGAGSSSWERCCLGLPSVLVVVAENQVRSAERLVEGGAAHGITLGEIATRLPDVLTALVDDPYARLTMARASSRQVDGLGVGRVIAAAFKEG